MKKILALICVLVATSGVTMANFRSSAATKANGDYKHALDEARKKYVIALKSARDAAMEKKDLEEANAIDAELKRYAQDEAPDEPKVPLTVKDLYDSKLGYFVLPDATLVFKSNGVVDSDRGDFKGEKFWKFGNDGILRLFGPSSEELTSQYLPVRRGNMVFWLGQLRSNGQTRMLVQQAH